MLKQLRTSLARWLWTKANLERPNGWEDYRQSIGVHCADEAKRLSPVYAAFDLYKRTLPTLPLITYKADANGRTRAKTNPNYKILHDRVNPGMSPVEFFEIVVDDYFSAGQFVGIIQWKNNNNLQAIYPVPPCNVLKISRNPDWSKVYTIQTENGSIDVNDSDVIHIMKDTNDGLCARGIVDYASENLTLHRQIQVSANSYYRNAAKPSGYLSFTGGVNDQAHELIKKTFRQDHQGTTNAGSVPIIPNGGTYNGFPSTAASDAQIVEALSLAVADVARWFGLSPLLLADLTRGTYSNLSADNESFYQRSLRPLLVKIEQEINYKIFGLNSQFYAEFLTEAVLRGSPEQQQSIFNGYVQSGVMTIAEVRERLDLPFLPTSDIPMRPVNQAVVTGAADAVPLVSDPATIPTENDIAN